MSMLQLKNVSLNFVNADKSALSNINYEIGPGDFVILLGSNGSGKSSLLKLLHRDYQHYKGEIYFKEKPLAQYSHKKFSSEVAVLTQDCSHSLFSSLTIFENYLLITPSIKKSRAAERDFLKNYLLDFNPKLANKLDLPIERLSGGEKQALALAFCLLKPPALLLLDEHTSALDPKTSEQIMRLTQNKILEHHITCILTTHDLDIALDFGNRILMLREGEIQHRIESDEKAKLTKNMLMKMYY